MKFKTMIIAKIKNMIKLHFENQEAIKRSTKEIEWAHIFFDATKGYQELEKLSIFPGRWAANYSLFYITFRVLQEIKPKKILEFGLGETSKFISTFNEHYNPKSQHLIIEHDESWVRKVTSSFSFPVNSQVILKKLIRKSKNGFEYFGYEDLETIRIDDVMFFLVDGPFGSENFSRYDIFEIIVKAKKVQSFVIVVDDYNRKGEKETISELLNFFNENKIEYAMNVYQGSKDQIIIASKDLSYITSI